MELSRKLRVTVSGGLHARPAAEVVRLSKGFAADLKIEAAGGLSPTRSSLKLIMLGVKEGDEVTLHASGADAEAALDALAAVLGGAGGHAPAPVAVPPPVPDAVQAAGEGLGVSPGVALGPVFLLQQPALEPETEQAEPGAAIARAEAARAEVAARCRDGGAADPARAEVLAALAELVADSDWGEAIAARIHAGEGALKAVRDSAEQLAREIAALPDAYAAGRAEDMRGAGELVALAMQGKRPVTPSDAPEGAVLVAEEISAVHLGHGDLSHVAGIVTARGARNGHAAILARSAGIPAVFGLGAGIAAVMAGVLVALDGATGRVVADPDEGVAAEFRAALEAAAAEKAALAAWKDIRPITEDGTAITVAGNIGGIEDARRAKAAGAMGIGLMRTEFLFLDRNDLPGEEEQLAIYRAVLECFPDEDVIIRTLDIGGDKPARGIPVAPEENPFLGLRGIRLCLAHPAVFRLQLRALLRAAVHGRLMVMLPMIADPAEIRATRDLLAQCRAELLAEGLPHADFPLGIMVETPAAVFQAEALAAEADFFSIGTNDLSQYVMAADRMNPAVAGLCRADHPAVMAAIREVCRAAALHGRMVGVCGEAAGDPALIPFLLEAGVRELSMVPGAVAAAKRQISGLYLHEGEDPAAG